MAGGAAALAAPSAPAPSALAALPPRQHLSIPLTSFLPVACYSDLYCSLLSACFVVDFLLFFQPCKWEGHTVEISWRICTSLCAAHTGPHVLFLRGESAAITSTGSLSRDQQLGPHLPVCAGAPRSLPRGSAARKQRVPLAYHAVFWS